MSFILRAGLVIGALSYLAATRGGSSTTPPALSLRSPETATAALGRAWEALPGSTRDAALREGAALVVRHAGGAAPSSRDTLAEIDRRPSWRGP